MVRTIVGVIVGFIAWLVIVGILSVIVGRIWPEMAAIKDMTALTVPMLIARLCISGGGSIGSGLIAALIGRDRMKAPLGAGVLLLAGFVPYHLTIWHEFPVWYHLTFFASLPLLSLAGGRLRRPR